jgi:MinD superfamily P-loop ATPase
MIISFASGKGGTGKTTVATSFAQLLSQEIPSSKIQFLDCDVEEPNAAIFLRPEIIERLPIEIPVPIVDLNKCNYCGKCSEICSYNAIAVIKRDVLIFPELCHGCGGCTFLCPEHAISETAREIGIMETGKAGAIEFIQGRLNIGEPMATPLIRDMKQYARNQASNNQITIIDVPPGTSCPVIEAVKGSNFSVLVTEPTPFGLNDLILAVEALRKLNIPFGVVINRDGIGDEGVKDYCERKHIQIMMRIPNDREVAVAYSKGISLAQINSRYKSKFQKLYKQICKTMNKNETNSRN